MLVQAAVLARLLALPLALVLATPDVAVAEITRCAQADTDLSYTGTDFVEIAGDTGWFPSWSVAQLRLTGRVAGHTALAAGYTAKGCWDETMKASLAGTPGTGFLDVAYGAAIALHGRIHTSVLGQTINWEGQIPIPYIPEDLLIAGTRSFDPALDTTGASVSDTTDPVNVLSTNLLSSVISLGGISGGLYVSVRGGMTSTYRAKKTTLGSTAVDAVTDLVSIARPSGGFKSTLSLPVAVEGTVRYQPSLTFAAGFDLKIFGIQVVNWELLSVPMSLPPLERAVKLSGTPAVLGLPELDGIGDGARMDFAAASTQALRVKNLGQGPLQVEPTAVPAGITVAPLSLQPGEEAELRVTVSDGGLAGGAATLVFNTNDPDRPRVELDLGMDVGGTDAGEPPMIEGSEGGCSTGGGQGSGLALVLVAFAAVSRRRRAMA